MLHQSENINKKDPASFTGSYAIQRLNKKNRNIQILVSSCHNTGQTHKDEAGEQVH
jgi:hypothetical protein